jgi:hypothetical protein
MLNISKFSSTDVHGHIYTYAPPEILKASISITWDIFPTPNIGNTYSFAKFIQIHEKYLLHHDKFNIKGARSAFTFPVYLFLCVHKPEGDEEVSTYLIISLLGAACEASQHCLIQEVIKIFLYIQHT